MDINNNYGKGRSGKLVMINNKYVHGKFSSCDIHIAGNEGNYHRMTFYATIPIELLGKKVYIETRDDDLLNIQTQIMRYEEKNNLFSLEAKIRKI